MAKYKEGGKRSILQMKNEIGGSSAIHLGTLLEQAINSHCTHLILDFSRVLNFEYTGVVLSVAVLEFYARDFSKITCRGLPRNIARILKGLGVEKIPNVEIVDYGNSRKLAVSNP